MIRKGLFVLFVCVFILGLSQPIISQSTFQKYISITDSLSEGYCISALNNGRIAVGGSYSDNLTFGFVDAVIFTLDQSGNLLWSLKLGTPENGEVISDIESLSDGGMLINYISYQPNTSSLNFSGLMRLSSTGQVLWSKKISDGLDIIGTNITEVTGGFIFNGYSEFGNNTALAKLDINGNLLWSKIYTGIGIGNSGITEDNSGNIHIFGRLANKGIWAKLNGNNGALINAKSYSGLNLLAIELGELIQNDSLVLIGRDYSNNFVVFKTDLNGSPGGAIKYTYNSGVLTPLAIYSSGNNGSFVISIYQDGVANPSGLVVQFKPNLSIDWSKKYVEGKAAFFDMDKTVDGYVVTGSYKLNLKEQTFVAKMDNRGDIEGRCCPSPAAFTQSATSISQVTSGIGSLSEITLENFTITPQTVIASITDLCPGNEQAVLSDNLICPGQCVDVQMTGNKPGVSYLWHFTGGSPDSSSQINPGMVCYNSKGDYNLILTSEGCPLDTAKLVVDLVSDKFPNAFSPNGDGANEELKPIIECPFEEYRMQVFNRWGDLVYETFNIDDGWDGIVNDQPAPVDTYIYRVEFYAVRDGVRVLVFNEMKEVTLLR